MYKITVDDAEVPVLVSSWEGALYWIDAYCAKVLHPLGYKLNKVDSDGEGFFFGESDGTLIYTSSDNPSPVVIDFDKI